MDVANTKAVVVKEQDLIDSICEGLQYISYYHPPDFIEALNQAYAKEISPAAKNAIGQILINSRMCAEGRRPICQDTGIVVVFLKIGMQVRWQTNRSITAMVNEGVRRAYIHDHNPLRASIVSDPAGKRINTGDNTPAVIHTEVVPGDKVDIILAAKGGGSENKAKFVILNPSDSIVEWVVNTVPTMGAGWCPPGVLGIGIGGTAEKAMLLAKEALMTPINIQELINTGPQNSIDELRLDIYEQVNKLGIGAQGLGGLVSVLDVKIKDYPTHVASKPVAMIPNCAATRHIHFALDGSGPAQFVAPDLTIWPDNIHLNEKQSRRIDLNTVTREDISQWLPGETLLLSGKLLTGRDAAHKRIVDLIINGQPLPEGIDFNNRFIYYVGPVGAVDNEVIGPAGPTTATRMDKFTDIILENTGLMGMIGKAERGTETVNSIKKHAAVYLIATGGAAYLISKSIRSARVIAFADLGMEAIQEFVIKDMPVTVAVDTKGNSIHSSGPALWRQKIADIPII